MPFHLLPSLLALVCAVGGVALTTRDAALSLAESGEAGLANMLGITSPSAGMSSLLAAVGGKPAALSAPQREAVSAAIRHVPLNGTAYLILSGSAAAQGKTADARALAQAALKRDPRLVAAWLWLLRDSAASGRFQEAAKFSVSALNLRPQDKAALDALVLITNAPEAQPVILEALKQNPDWRSSYLGGLGKVGHDRAFIYRAMAIGQPATINLQSERSQLLFELTNAGEYDRAYTAWLSWLTNDALSAVDYVYDGGFRTGSGIPPFAWSFTQAATGSASAGENGLDVSVDGTSAGQLASQMLLLAPGRYRLITAVRSTNGEKIATGTPLAWTLTCAGRGTEISQTPIPLDRAPIRIASSVFSVGGDCPAQSLTLKSKAMEYPAQVLATLESVKIEAIK